MGDRSGIEWTDATWNPVTGCNQVSPGCDNCYALRQAARLKRMGSPRYQTDGHPASSGPGFGVACHHDLLDQPRRWQRPRKVFVNSMSDLFHPAVPDEFVADVFAVMNDTPRHTFQVLTKRAKRLARLAPDLNWTPNIWIGVSIENNRYAWRADYLRAVPDAAIRFISAEPILGTLSALRLHDIDWVIAGGESGPGHRPLTDNPGWVRELRDICHAQNVPFFFKQWGGTHAKAGGNTLDGETYLAYPQSPATAGVG